MKRVLTIAVGLALLLSVSVFAGDISTDDAAGILKGAIKKAGYSCDVEVGDVDKNGVMDFALDYKGGGEGDQIIMLLAAVTGGVAGLAPNLSWKVDKVFVMVEEDLYYTTATKCSMCAKVISSDDSTEEEVKECLKSIWEEKEG